jgi:hypothetical protein
VAVPGLGHALSGRRMLGGNHGVEATGQCVDLGKEPIVLEAHLGGVVDRPLRADVVAQSTPGPGESGLHPDLHRQIAKFS